jgi:hypothetical protein
MILSRYNIINNGIELHGYNANIIMDIRRSKDWGPNREKMGREPCSTSGSLRYMLYFILFRDNLPVQSHSPFPALDH